MIRFAARLVVLIAVLGAPVVALGQTLPGMPSPAAAAAKPATPSAPALSPAEAQSVLDVLNDPAKRAAFQATLETFIKAAKATAPKPATEGAVPLAPNSLGAEVVEKTATWFSELSGQVSAFNQVLGNLPSVWAFTERTVRNPASRAQVIRAGAALAAILAAALILEWVFSLLLRRPIGALARHAPGGAPAPAPPDDDAAATATEPLPPAHPKRFSRSVRLMRRLPYAALRLILEAVPLAAFLGLGYAGMLFTPPDAEAVLWVAITAYIACRAVVIVTRAIASPEHQSLRLMHISDQGAAYAVVWVRRLALVMAFGFAASQIGVEFGLPDRAREAFIKAVMLLDHLFLVIIVLQCRKSVAAKIRGPAGRHGVTAELRARLARVWHLLAIFVIMALWVVWAAQVRHGYAKLGRLFIVSVAVLIAARVVALVVLGGLDRAFRISPDMAGRYPGLEARANRYYPLLRGTLVALLLGGTALALLQAWGVNTLAWFHGSALGGRVFSAILTVLIAGAMMLAVWEGVNASMERHLARLTREAQMVRSARLRTLLPILRTVLLITLLAVFGLTALSEIGVNIAPLLAGAGILGVAIGFGSQKLVQDFITGIFLLLENAMQVGDWVTVAGLSGSVENLSIRTMRLRAGDGSVHIIPFSSVSTVTNVNRGIGNAAVSVTVPLEEDTDHVSDVLAEIAKEMREERRFADMMRSDFQLWGVDKVDAGVATIVGQIVCTDGGRWAVQREFNRRMNMRFKEAGIRIASPVQTVLNGELPRPLAKIGHGAAPTLPESPPPAALGNTS
jgi:small-conductance mechanosensitive channel